MAYRISGLDHGDFSQFFSMNEAELNKRNAVRVTASADEGWPCRVSLDDAKTGDSLILINYVSHDVANPFHTAYAIYVREIARERAEYHDDLPPFFQGRTMSLRGFDADGMLSNAVLATPGNVDVEIRTIFKDLKIAYIHAHFAAQGCFAAKVERD